MTIATMASCRSKQTENIVQNFPAKKNADTIAVKFTAASVANKYDFACGMPVTAGIEDTVHYKGKIYGFCSAECKADFLKKPAAYLTKKASN